MQNSIMQMVVMLLVVGVILFFASPYLPASIVQLIIAVAAIGCLLWALKASGWWTGPGA